MTGERPRSGSGAAADVETGSEADRRPARRASLRLCALLLAGAALAGAPVRPAFAQGAAQPDPNDPLAPSLGAGSPSTTPGAGPRPGLGTGLPGLRGGPLGQPLGTGLGIGLGGGLGNGSGGASGQGAGNGVDDGAGAGVGNGAAVARLPRFRSGLSATGVPGIPSSSLRLRAAPPRRIGSATQALTRRPRTQAIVTDLRLTPVIQSPVSGVPLPASLQTPVPLPTTIPLLGLSNPARLLLGASTVGRALDEPDPAYAPLGIKLGTFTIVPSFTQSVGYDDNPDQTTPRAARGSLALRSEGDVAFRSDWSSSAFEGQMRGAYSAFPDNEPASRPSADGGTRLRIDIDRDTHLDWETRFFLDTQRVGSPDLTAAGASGETGRPIFATYGTSVGVTEAFNRVQLTLRGSFDRQVFEDAQLGDGSTIIQSDRNANQYGVRLRAGYEISPVITPFVEAILDTRIYDTPIDQSGFRRDSDGTAFTAGAQVLLSRFLSAEASVGLQRRDYVDRRLRSITAPLVNAALIWQASPLTTVRFTQVTGVAETSVPGSAGVFTDSTALEVQHELLRNLSVTLGGAYLSNTYQGSSIREHGITALARLDYRVNRWLTLRGSYVYQRIDSSEPLSSYKENSVLVGLRVNP